MQTQGALDELVERRCQFETVLEHGHPGEDVQAETGTRHGNLKPYKHDVTAPNRESQGREISESVT